MNRLVQGFAVHREAFVKRAVVCRPPLQGLVERHRVDAYQHIANDAR
jgi:hypothetical protein